MQVRVLPFPLKAGPGRGQLAAAACESSAQMGAPNARMRPFRPGFPARQCLLVIPSLFRTTAPVLAQASGISPKATAKSQILAPHLCQGRAPCGHSIQHPIARVKARARARAVQPCATPGRIAILAPPGLSTAPQTPISDPVWRGIAIQGARAGLSAASRGQPAAAARESLAQFSKPRAARRG